MGGPAGIPFSEIVAYVNFHQIVNVEERDNYVMFVLALDNTYLEHIHNT